MVPERLEEERYASPSSPSYRIFEKDGTQILVDDVTLDFIKGSTIDYKAEMIKQSFEVVANPNAEVGCSCGTSFAPKDK